MFGSKDLLFSSETYGVAKSLRFRRSASAQLTRTPGSAGNRKTWTWSGWVKRGLLATGQGVFCAVGAATDTGSFYLTFFTTDIIRITGQATVFLETTQVFRDPSSWYHIVLAMDTTNATANNRLRLYVNGSEVTAFATRNNLTLNTDYGINQASVAHYLMSYNTAFCDGYLAEVNFIDGQALTPSSFGFYDNNGIWQPRGYTGTYGTNGFYLNFSDNSAATATTIGKDTSGNGNNWTPNNISVTAGITYDSMIDSPTNYADGGNGRGNYCVLNYISTLTTATLAAGNLQYTSAVAGENAIGTIGMSSGKWYWEAQTSAGTTQARATVYGTSAATYYSFAANNTVYGFRFDAGAGTFEQTADGTTWTSVATGLTSGPYFPYFNNNGTTSKTIAVNFGQRPFSYTIPSGYLALNTQNLSTPTIPNGAQYMAAVLYTGTGSSQTITASSTNSGNNPNGTTFQPDWVWVKGRSGATDHALYDAVRGVQLQLESNTTTAETTETTGLTAFTSSGFTTGALAQMNTNTATYVAWEWNAGGSNATNTSGSITSTVRANTSAGFSVVTYTGNGANATVGHGLGVAPSMIIVKNRNSTFTWRVYHASLANTQVLYLSATDAATTETTAWNSTTPASTVFSIGTSSGTNGNTNTYVAYCFAPVAGYSAFGSYTGNGSADGPFVYTGFRPRFILYKRTDATSSWGVHDTSRDTYNVSVSELYPDLSQAEATASTGNFDFLSNGFKLRSTIYNASGGTYIYAAFAENSFKISRAR